MRKFEKFPTHHYCYENLETGLIPSVNVAENKVDYPVVVWVPLLPFAVAHSYCAVDGRCFYGSGGCWDWNKPSCRCYRLVPCWAWCARSVCAASTALRKSGFCCKAHIETHRSCCCRPTDLAAEPDTGLLLFFVHVSNLWEYPQIDTLYFLSYLILFFLFFYFFTISLLITSSYYFFISSFYNATFKPCALVIFATITRDKPCPKIVLF